MRRSAGLLPLACIVLSSSLPGCKCGEDRPYTPFRITGSASGAGSSVPPSPSGSASSEPSAREAVVAPLGASTFTIDGVALSVDPERVIDRALSGDFDGDGQKDAVAWTRLRGDPPDAQTSGELEFFGGKSPAGRVVATSPPFVPSGPTCRQTVSLTATGPHTVTLDVAAQCDAHLVPRSPVRGIVVVAPANDRPTLLALRVADAAPSESFTLVIDSTDRDADGRDDVGATITLKSSPDDPGASADLVWLDRAAGPSRDPTEPKHSFDTLASLEAVRARGKSTSKEVPLHIADARRLYATLCAEGATPRVFDADGAPLLCDGMGPELAALTAAEVRAALSRRDVLGATAALAHDGFYGAPLSEKDRGTLQKALFLAAPKRSVTVHAIAAVPRAKAGLPRFSPLSFADDGSLLVQTADHLVRARLPDDTEETADDVAPWSLTVGGATEPHWTGAGFPCDRSEVVLVESDPSGTPLPSVPTTLLAPRPGPCRGSSPPAVELTPLEWTATERAGLIGGALFGAPDLGALSKPAPQGSPRSLDGHSLVFPSRLGVLVTNAGKSEIWTAPDAATLSDCVVSNGATRVACVRANHAVWLEPGEEPLTRSHSH